MKVLCGWLLLSIVVLAHSQTTPQPADTANASSSITDFGLAYPLTNDWVRATDLLRKRFEPESSLQIFDVLLAAVYVPKENVSSTNPFFSLLGYRQPGGDCMKSLEAVITHSQNSKEKPEGGVVQFSAAGRDYFRLNMAHGAWGRHQSMICTMANGHLLVWHAGAPNEKGLDKIVSTLNSIATLPTKSTQEAEPSAKDGAAEKPANAQPEKVRVSSGVTSNLLVKRVNPVYPEEARLARIQGTVLLRAEISKSGDITDLELIDGPIELAGSAVAAVRQWKYKPFLLQGQPVTVETQLKVNYELR